MKEQPRLRYEADTIAKQRQETITQHRTAAGHYTPPHGGTTTAVAQHIISKRQAGCAWNQHSCTKYTVAPTPIIHSVLVKWRGVQSR